MEWIGWRPIRHRPIARAWKGWRLGFLARSVVQILMNSLIVDEAPVARDTDFRTSSFGFVGEGCMKNVFRRNGLSITLFGLFLLFQLGLSVVGLRQYNQEQTEHGQFAVGYLEYVSSASFIEATMENWESEFLQMFAYVFLTTFLYQWGSAESKKLDEPEPVDRDPRLSSNKEESPSPVRKGGLTLKLYEHSLTLALLVLFFISFVLHAISGAWAHSEQELEHGGEPVSVFQYLGTAQFWFESLQNWQSEFFSIGMMVVLSIFLRQRGSPESKPVDSPHSETGHA
jgi:hypothetical protein